MSGRRAARTLNRFLGLRASTACCLILATVAATAVLAEGDSSAANRNPAPSRSSAPTTPKKGAGGGSGSAGGTSGATTGAAGTTTSATKSAAGGGTPGGGPTGARGSHGTGGSSGTGTSGGSGGSSGTGGSGATTGSSGAGTSTGTSAGSSTLLGVLGVSGQDFQQEKSAGVDVVTISVGWIGAEPAEGSFSTSYILGVQNEIDAARSAGLGVVLDPGLQYPPDWVFSLPGGTRFVDQYGDQFTGTEASGNNVANAFTDMAVRSAESTYLEWLGTQIPGSELVAVRQGGGPLGELRYPTGDYNGHTNCYWAYDASTQAASPVPGWVPGTGTTAQAASFLNSYNAALDGYGDWLNGQLEADFGTEELVMLPGWGQRPGGAASEISSLLTLDMDEYNQGLDWTDLLSSLPDPDHSVAYTTYLDAPTVEPTLQLEDPADYLATLVAGTPIRLGGENTGDGTIADMDLCASRAEDLHLFIFQWMDEAQLLASAAGQDPGGPTLAMLGAAMTSSSA